MNRSGIQIAVVDDDPSFLRALERLLRATGFMPLTYASGEAFLLERPRGPLDCAILDVRLGAMTGLDVARKLTAEECRVPIIFMTAHDDTGPKDEAEALGCVAYMRKPFSAESLLEAIRQATLSNRAAAEVTGGHEREHPQNRTNTRNPTERTRNSKL